jgi:hypothetical protein
MSSNQNKKNKTKKAKKNTIVIPSIASDNEITLTTLHDTLRSMQQYMVARFDNLEYRMTGLERTVTGLERTVTGIHKDIKRFDDYIKVDVKIQEKNDLYFITKLYLHNHQNKFVTPLDINDLYDRSGNPLTDFDGIIMIHNLPLPFVFPLRDMDMIEYIVTESKHSVSKTKIDAKIRQMVQLTTYLSEVSHGDESKLLGHENFIGMIHQFIEETHLPLKLIAQPITLLFASDDISDPLAEYITRIHEGIDNQQIYDEIVKKLFFNNLGARKILKSINNNMQIPLATKAKVAEETATMSSIRDAFTNELQHMADLSINEHLTPYDSLADAFHMMKHHIGYVQFGMAYCPTLFPIKSLNRMI